MDKKEYFNTFYRALSSHEKNTFWFGSITFAIGFLLLIKVLIPPSWSGWAETQGELLGAESMKTGQFGAGTTVFLLQYTPQNGEVLQGTFKISPIILSTMKTIRVFYQKTTPSVFYVHNPTWSVIAVTMTLFGGGVLVAFFLYNRDKQRGITY